MKRRGIRAVSLCTVTACWLTAGETVKRHGWRRGRPAPAPAPETDPAKILVNLHESDTADTRESIGSSADIILHSLS